MKQPCRRSLHGWYLPLTGGNALKFFLEPVIASINYLSSQYQYQDFNMIGLSGGGWTTTIVPAVDTRIKLSFPVAGSVPLGAGPSSRHRHFGSWSFWQPIRGG